MIEDNDLVLLVDIDDLLVFSSPQLQKIVNEKTNFKTETLHMFEQLNRNCRYIVDEVKKECRLAKEENRKPELDRFGVYDGVTFTDEEMYDKPIQAAEYYLFVAGKFLDQFLEERDSFLEIDNLSKEFPNNRKYYNYEKEMSTIIKYSEYIHNNMAAFHKINEFCFREVDRIIKETKAKDSKAIPDFGALVSMDSNDIVKKGDLNGEIDTEAILNKPLVNTLNCIKNESHIHDIVTNAQVFFTPSNEIVDYESIHSVINVNWDAVYLVKRLIDSGKFKEVCFSTHHNGSREVKAKIKLMRLLFPEIPIENFLDQRFHDEEHNANRRGRSSKSEKAINKKHIKGNQIVLLDDSKANCLDCKKHGGVAIWYKPLTDAEIINGKIEDTEFVRIFDFKDEKSYDIIMEAIEKHKVKCKRK